ncbi:N-acetyltransferase 5 [Savitreella phatthalungensis]
MPTPHKIAVDDITANQLGTFKKLHNVLFPIEYPANFFRDALNGQLTISKLAYFNDIAVGCLCVRITPEKNGARLYIATLGVLAPYRELGVGAKMLEYIETAAKDIKAKELTLHVQEGNEARAWYEKRGFLVDKVESNYYPRSEVTAAVLLKKSLAL